MNVPAVAHSGGVEYPNTSGIAWYQGDTRVNHFVVQGSSDNARYVDLLSSDSSGKENYVWEELQGAVVQAELLHRAGYDAWNWSDKALLRAVLWETNVARFPTLGCPSTTICRLASITSRLASSAWPVIRTLRRFR